MANYRRSNRQQNEQTEQPRQPREALKIDKLTVTRARRWDDGNETFDMDLNGISIYGCRLVEGKNGLFVSFPARKGNDGKYYSHVYATLDDVTVEAICRQVDDLLAKQ